MASLIQNLQEKIDQQHQEALRALAVLKKYFAESPNGQVQSPDRKVSFKDQVLNAIREDWLTVTAIAETTGLTIKRVRGVVNAPNLKDGIEKKEVGGQTAYRLKEA